MSDISHFESKGPINHRKRDLSLIIFFGFLLITPVIYNYFQDLPPSNISTFYISYSEKLDSVDYINCKFQFESDRDSSQHSINGKIRYRGQTAHKKYPKQGYRIELEEQVSLLEMRIDDDWLLFESYCDFSRMRVKLAFDLWRSLRDMDHEHAILPDSKYIELYINGEFNGLYLLSEKNDRKLFNLDRARDNSYSSLIFQNKGKSDLREYKGSLWEQDWPDPNENNIMPDILKELISFIKEPNEIFFDPKNGIYSKFNKINLIDFFLYNYFIYHEDFWYSNYFIIRNTYPNKFFLIPWDFDRSFGAFGWIEYSSEKSDIPFIHRENALYDRLLDNDDFKEDCKDRWKELREELWTDDFVLGMLRGIYREIKEELKKEMELWEPERVEHEDEITRRESQSTKEFILSEHIDYLFDWVEERLEFCDTFFSDF